LDQVWAGDVEQIDLQIPPGSFDAIVCADVLEHLREPARLLKQAREWLSREGHLIASIPNVRHHSVIRSLLQGNWTYESAGLLDRTHLRFFTRREIEKLFNRAGFAIEGMWSVNGPGDGPSQRNGAGPVHLGRLCIDGLSQPDADEFYTYQFLIRARALQVPDYGLTSIVIVTHNQVEYTRQCVDSIRLVTDEPYELIVVDNGSTDGTVEFLRAFPDVRVIVNDTNRGFPAAANQGMAVANGRQVLLLNNDVVVTTGWLGRMLRAIRSDTRVGLVGPCSNYVSGPQQVDVSYDGIAELDGFAWDWGKSHGGQVLDVHTLVGFCLLIKREVIDAIGLLDERFGIGCFEDDDYCLRAIAAGYRAIIASDAFVHHYGSRTFLGSGVDGGAVMRENYRRFQEKWSGNGVGASAHPAAVPIRPSLPPPAGAPSGTLAPRETAAEGRVRAASTGVLFNGAKNGSTTPHPVPRPFAVDISPDGGLRLRLDLGRPKLSLCMIVRDNAGTLPACLESIRPWVDEMIVVDTGSVDETPRIVESFGAKLFHFPWCDDFSAARNESLRHATGDWLFWMDSDDTIPPECGRGLRELVENQKEPSVVAYVMQVHCPGGGEQVDRELNVTVVDQWHYAQALEACRQGRGLFPRDVELRFREGVLMHEIGWLAEARNAYLSVLSDGDDRHFSSVDKGLNGFMAHTLFM
jgi:O-antigen biosynthesis protein